MGGRRVLHIVLSLAPWEELPPEWLSLMAALARFASKGLHCAAEIEEAQLVDRHVLPLVLFLVPWGGLELPPEC